MNDDFNVVLGATVRTLVLGAFVLVGVGFLLIDVLVVHNGIRELSFTEIGQEAFLFLTAVLFWYIAQTDGFAGFGALVGGLFGCMFIRELDGPTDLIRHGIWKYPAWVLAVICIYIAWRDRRNVLPRMAEFVRMPCFGVIASGLCVILIYSRLLGIPQLWAGILEEGYVKTAKHAAEEGTETLGYCLCLAASLDYWRVVRLRLGSRFRPATLP